MVNTSNLQALPPSRLDRQRQHRQERSKEQGAAGVDRCLWIPRTGVHGDDGRAKSRDAVQETRDPGPAAAVRRWEDFGGVGVEDLKHNTS